MDEFKDLVGDMPSTELRVGYQATWPPASPPVIEAPQIRRQQPRQRQTG